MVGQLQGLRVLAAEDDRPSLGLTLTLVKIAGADAVGVTNGQDAVNTVKDQHVDVILMDVQMPVMDGLSATREIREHERESGSRVLIVGVTAHAMPEHVGMCHAAGMDAVITKPIDPASFAQTIRTHYDGMLAG